MAASQSQGRVGQVKLCSLTPSAKGNFCLGCRGVGTFLIVAWQGGGESGHRAIFLQREEQCGCLQAPGWDCASTKDFFFIGQVQMGLPKIFMVEATKEISLKSLLAKKLGST